MRRLPGFRHLELVAWKPRRRNAAGREPTRYVLGVTNHDKANDWYFTLTETDWEIDIEELTRRPPYPIAMVIETRKGYHIYWADPYRDPRIPVSMMRRLVGLRLEDTGHLKLARRRDPPFAVLRVSPKYRRPDLVPVYVDPRRMSAWHAEVLQLIVFCCAYPDVCEKIAREVVKKWV